MGPSTGADRPAPRILVVDDYEDACELLQALFEQQGYRVITAPDGVQAVILAQQHHPDAVVMDVYMPGMDGVEATRQIKSDPALRDTVVIAHTARAAPAEDDTELFDAVCPKPCAPDQILAAVKDALDRRDK